MSVAERLVQSVGVLIASCLLEVQVEDLAWILRRLQLCIHTGIKTLPGLFEVARFLYLVWLLKNVYARNLL